MEPTIFLDESGNTGANLLDNEQPCFTMAGVDLANEDAEMLLSLVNTKSPKEVHFSSLKRKKSGQDGILRLLKHPLICGDNIKACIYHKEFMITTKIVDILIENMANETGFDLYKDGFNIALSNTLYYCMPAFCGAESVANMQGLFIEMIKYRTPHAIDAFYKSIESMKKKCSISKFASDLDFIAATEYFATGALENIDKSHLDPLSSCLFYQGIVWGKKYPTGFNLIHDESKQLKSDKGLLEEFMQWIKSDIEVGYDRRKFNLPLKARSLRFATSDAHPQIQVADVVTSAICFWAKGKSSGEQHDEFFLALDKLDFNRLLVMSVWPSLDVTPEALGTVHDGGLHPANASAKFLMEVRNKRPI